MLQLIEASVAIVSMLILAVASALLHRAARYRSTRVLAVSTALLVLWSPAWSLFEFFLSKNYGTLVEPSIGLSVFYTYGKALFPTMIVLSASLSFLLFVRKYRRERAMPKTSE